MAVQTVNSVTRSENSPKYRVGDVYFMEADELGRFYFYHWLFHGSENHIYKDTKEMKEYSFRMFRQLFRNVHQDWFKDYPKLAPLLTKKWDIRYSKKVDADRLIDILSKWPEDIQEKNKNILKISTFSKGNYGPIDKDPETINLFIFDEDESSLYNEDIENFVRDNKNVFSFAFQV